MQSTRHSPTALAIEVFPSKMLMAQAVARTAAEVLRDSIARQGHARILVGTGNSQLEMIDFLTRERHLDWPKVEVFHLDEYVGLPATHPASFRRWLRIHVVDKVRPRSVHYVEGDATDLDGMMQNYARQLLAAPIDLAFLGFGENGHIAFNDPHVADFDDPLVMKRVTLDEACRRQQAGEGHFPDLQSVPREAVTITCSGLFRVRRWICCVPDRRKAEAVRRALEGPVSTECPASLVNRHPSAAVFLDPDSASLLSPSFLERKCRVHSASDEVVVGAGP